MNCFNHQNEPAVGLCKVCGKALCRECLAEEEEGIVCRGSCEGHGAGTGQPTIIVAGMRGIRRRSEKTLCGLPLYDIAMGPDPSTGEMRGHAHGIIAIGDIARGWFAFGGLASGYVAFGGLALGGLAIGGCAVGLIALGGCAIGGWALGGAAIGYFAVGGGAFGKYSISGAGIKPGTKEYLEQLLSLIN